MTSVARDAKFHLGQVVRHRLYPFRGVIFDVDPVFANTEEWWQAIPAEIRPHKDQPFYHLFAENEETEYVAYVSEQNLLADTSGWGPDTFTWWSTWGVILAGAGAIFILMALARLAMPEYRRPIAGGLILGAVFLAVGLGQMTTWGWGALATIVLIVIGLTMVLRGVSRRR